jgi:purine-cytosine permease-like protein
MYGFWSWIPSFIIFLIVLGTFARSGKFHNIPMRIGSSEAGSILSFSAAVFGFATGWTSVAADYTVYQPATTSQLKIFIAVFVGLIFPLIFTQSIGLAVATATANDPVFADAYHSNHVGGLLAQLLFSPLGKFGEFCLAILALSIVGSNTPTIYSFVFSLQILARQTQSVPRFVWTIVGTLIYCGIAIPGYSHFESVLENFMLITVSSPGLCEICRSHLLFLR